MVGTKQLAAQRNDFATLPLAVVRRIDELADEFEAAWHSGATPDPQTFVERLDGADNEARAVLAAHLIQLESELNSVRCRPPQITAAGSQAASVRAEAGTTGLSAAPTRGRDGVSQMAAPPREIQLCDHSVQVGEYRLLEQLGSGGMGVVYKAVHTRLDRCVAIKFPRFAAALDPRSAARFLREARMIGRLNHPHVVRALDAGESVYGPYLVTEFIEGETLEDRVRRAGPLPVEQAIAFTRQAACALDYAHAQNIVHRDVKPSNLLLDGANVLRIVDFGLAKMLADDQRTLSAPGPTDHTECGTFLGTVAYAAPEQLQPGRPVDRRADVYALGCVFYFAVTGEPFHGGSLADRLLASRKSKTVSPRLNCGSVSPPVERVWRRMVAPAAKDRFDSMAELDDAFDEALAEEANGRWRSTAPRRRVFASLFCLAIGALSAWSAGLIGGRDGIGRQSLKGPLPPPAVAPFGNDQARRHQKAWAEYFGMPLRIVNSVEMPLVLLPPGEFMMGMSDAALPDPPPAANDWRYRDPEVVRQEQSPRHRVTLTQPLYFGETEVTNAQFRRFVEASGYVTDAERDRGWGKEDKGWVKRAGYSWKNLGQRLCKEDCPVINVTWNDASALCTWLTAHDGRGAYRLPTEAEWEFACRAGSTTTYFFGNDDAQLRDYAWLSTNADGLYRPVGTKKPNSFGLYDMYGNRQEWCLDNFEGGFYESSPVADPVCQTRADERVLRGGAHTDLPSFCTSARRWSQNASDPGASGIRIVCKLD